MLRRTSCKCLRFAWANLSFNMGFLRTSECGQSMSTFFMSCGEPVCREGAAAKRADIMAEIIHIGHIIQEELRLQGRSVAWLARQLGTSRMACYRLFHSYSIDTQVLFKISGLLGRDFFAVYSRKLAFNEEL